MTKPAVLGAVLATLLLAADPSFAATVGASPVTFVSGTGVDTGGCTRPAPCRTFAYALGQTSAGGIVSALDAAGYGAVAITQSVTIAGPGKGRASITPRNGADGIAINASGATVVLRGLEIDGGKTAIKISAAASVVISETVIIGSTNLAINAAATGASVLVEDTTVQGAQTETMAATFVAKRMSIFGSAGNGILVTAGHAVLDDCTISGSGSANVSASGGTTIIRHGLLAYGTTQGIAVQTGAKVYLESNSTNGNEQKGLVTGGTTKSYGNNDFPDGTAGTITPVSGN